MKTIKDVKTFDELLDIKYGMLGSKKRDDFEIKAKSFIVGEMIKEARKKAHLTQEDLAKRLEQKRVIFPGLRMVKLISNYQHFLRSLRKDWVNDLA